MPSDYAIGGVSSELFGEALRRVLRSHRLRKYDKIIFADWSEGDDHLRWVIRGRVGEIESWAKQIKEDSDVGSN